jgi:hypothetical protein
VLDIEVALGEGQSQRMSRLILPSQPSGGHNSTRRCKIPVLDEMCGRPN